MMPQVRLQGDIRSCNAVDDPLACLRLDSGGVQNFIGCLDFYSPDLPSLRQAVSPWKENATFMCSARLLCHYSFDGLAHASQV